MTAYGFDGIPEEFYRIFASWLRVEPRCRADDFSRGLEARIADPLWMLSRQWQMGELKGEDAGSPVRVSVSYMSDLIDKVRLGDADEYSPLTNNLPLEVLVEQEAVDLGWRDRIQIGQQFERILRRALGMGQTASRVIIHYRKVFPVSYPGVAEVTELDNETCRFLRLMAGRAIDGQGLLDAHEKRELQIPTWLNFMIRFRVLRAIVQWRQWYESLHTQPGTDAQSAWQPSTLDYRFAVGASDGNGRETTLSAPDYRNGELDWYSFDCESFTTSPGGPGRPSVPPHTPDPDSPGRPGRTPGTPGSGRPGAPPHTPDPGRPVPSPDPPTEERTETLHIAPARVTYAGMPHLRWWAFEDHDIDFGAMDVATTDVLKLVLMEFALIYGDDWFMVPLKTRAGSVNWIESITVTDVFGITSEPLPRAKDDGDNPLSNWDLFSLTNDKTATQSASGDFLFVPPAIGFREESQALEAVRFLRDEGANMVWGVERTVPNQLGNPVDGFEAQFERRERDRAAAAADGGDGAQPTTQDGGSGLPVYRLASFVPDNWVPFIPARAETSNLYGVTDASIRLRQARMLRNENDMEPVQIEAMTRLLSTTDPVRRIEWLNEEAVTRSGVSVQLTSQRVRWTDGKTYVWSGRKVTAGKGEGSSGLKFDVLGNR